MRNISSKIKMFVESLNVGVINIRHILVYGLVLLALQVSSNHVKCVHGAGINSTRSNRIVLSGSCVWKILRHIVVGFMMRCLPVFYCC